MTTPTSATPRLCGCGCSTVSVIFVQTVTTIAVKRRHQTVHGCSSSVSSVGSSIAVLHPIRFNCLIPSLVFHVSSSLQVLYSRLVACSQHVTTNSDAISRLSNKQTTKHPSRVRAAAVTEHPRLLLLQGLLRLLLPPLFLLLHLHSHTFSSHSRSSSHQPI